MFYDLGYGSLCILLMHFAMYNTANTINVFCRVQHCQGTVLLDTLLMYFTEYNVAILF